MCRFIRRFGKLLNSIKQSKKQRLYISDYFRKTALKYPTKAAIVFEDRQLTFRELDELSNQIANILRGAGLRHGNTAAVFMENSLEYLPVFLAMCKLGVTGILITCIFQKLVLSTCHERVWELLYYILWI